MLNIGSMLIEARKKMGMTQEDVATKLGVSRQAISKWENNETKPDVDNIFKLCEVLNLTVEDFKLPQREEKKHKINSMWGYCLEFLIVGIIIGIGMGYFIFNEKTIKVIPDDLIINQEVSAVNYTLTYKAIMKEDISNYHASCLFDDVSWEKAEDFEVEATIDKNVLTCRQRLARYNDVNVYVKLNNGEDEKVFYKYRVKILDEVTYMHEAIE